MAVKFNLSEIIREYGGAILLSLIIAFVAYIIYTIVGLVIGNVAPDITIPAIAVLFIIGLLTGILAKSVAANVIRVLDRLSPLMLILLGALIFGTLGAFFTFYSQTLQSYSIFGAVPLAVSPLADLLYKVLVAFVSEFIKGAILFGSLYIGKSIS